MNYTKISKEEILDWLKKNLNKERYEHSLGTADCAVKLANKYSLDKEKAYIAGLLHDCAKCFPMDKMLEIADKNIEIDDCEKNNPKTIHAPVSAYIAEKIFQITDKEILSSIRWHTIGQPQMSDFEKIIYIADKIENRTRKKEYSQPIIDELNKNNGLNRAMLQSYKQTIKSLVDRNLTICPLTINIYNKLLNNVN